MSASRTNSNEYEQYANETLRKIRNQLIYGSNARIDDERSDHKRSNAVRAIIIMSALINAMIYEKNAAFPVMALLSSLAIKKYGYGQCGELSQAAFVDLVNKNVYPIDLCVTTKGFHNLLVIDRAKGSDSSDISTWGDKAIILDVWANKVYPLSEFASMQKDTESGQYSSIITHDMPHYLSGTLKVTDSVQSESELIEFKSKMDIDHSIKEWFDDAVCTHDDLLKDCAFLSSTLEIIKSSALQYNLSAMTYITQINEYIRVLTLALHTLPEKPVPTSFFKHG